MTELLEIGPPFKRRRGVRQEPSDMDHPTAVGEQSAGEFMGMSSLHIKTSSSRARRTVSTDNQNQSMMINANEIVGLVKDLQVHSNVLQTTCGRLFTSDIRTGGDTGGDKNVVRLQVAALRPRLMLSSQGDALQPLQCLSF